MIELNPLVIRHELTAPPPNAPVDEVNYAEWYQITDQITYLPGIRGEVAYKACFYNLPSGLQTHVFAPMGVNIRSKWIVGGNLPGEPKEAPELGQETPREGLYIKEEVELTCNFLMSSFVIRNLQKSHKVATEKIVGQALRMQQLDASTDTVGAALE